MSVVLLRGALTFENYSETQIKLTVDDSGFVNEYFFNKKANLVSYSGTDQSILIISYYLDATTFEFRFTDIISPVCSSSEEFINIVDGWFYIVGPEVTVNGINEVGPLNTLNFIEGSNITITAVDDPTNNKVDITISSTGGGGGGVTAVTGTSPISSTGGTTPDISIAQADSGHDGYLSSTDWNTFNGKVDSVTATSPITSSGGTTPNISTNVNKNRLIGRNPVTAGVMEEISIGSGLSLSGTTLSASVNGSITHATASGTDTYTATITGVTSYADGDCYLIRFTNGNTTGATININSLGAVILYRNNDGALIGGDIVDGAEMLLIYNSTLGGFQCIGVAPNTLLAYVTNAETITITKGQPVYVSGGVGDRIKVKLAYNTSDATSAQTIGVVLSTSIAANQKGLVIVQGQLDGLTLFPTSTWADGDYIYLGATAGTITNVKPHAPNHLVYLGYVTTASNGSAGRWYVKVQNGYEMDEIHNVSAQTPSNNDGLFYNTGTSLWESKSIATALSYTPVSTALLINTTAPLTGGGNLSADRTLAITQATTSTNGYLSSTDWNTFNGKTISPWAYRLSGRFYTPSNNALSIGSLPNVSGSIRYSPVIIERDITITQLGISVVTIAAVGNTARVGIYSNNPSTNQPLNRLVDSGTIALDGAANSQRIVTGLSVTLTRGLYWFAYFSNASTGTIASIANLNLPDVIGTGTVGTLNNGLVTGYFQTLAYTTLPATASGLGTISSGASSYCIFYYY